MNFLKLYPVIGVSAWFLDESSIGTEKSVIFEQAIDFVALCEKENPTHCEPEYLLGTREGDFKIARMNPNFLYIQRTDEEIPDEYKKAKIEDAKKIVLAIRNNIDKAV